MAAKLSVNVNAIAFLRNRRNLPWPSVEEIGRIVLKAGAYGLTVHPRPDERHIRKSDVGILRDMIARDFPGREYNIEGNPDANFVRLVEGAKPHQVTLVPDDIRQITSDHGWDIAAHKGFLTDVIGRLKSSGMRVSLFIDADPELPGFGKRSRRRSGRDLYRPLWRRLCAGLMPSGNSARWWRRDRRQPRPASGSMPDTINSRRICRGSSCIAEISAKFLSVMR